MAAFHGLPYHLILRYFILCLITNWAVTAF